MKKVHHISHIDLDGYTCTYLVRHHVDYLGDQLVQTNVDYDLLTQHLTEVLESVDPACPLKELLITDLNLKPKDVSVLLAYRDRYEHFTLLDHHQNTDEQMKRLSDTIPCKLVLDRDQSATQHVYDHLVALHAVSPEVAELVRIVNTYDMFLVERVETFSLGYTLNENFMDLIVSCKGVASDQAIRGLSSEYLDAAMIRIYNLGEVGCLHPVALDEGLKLNLDVQLVEELETMGLLLPEEDVRYGIVTERLPYTQRVGVLQAALLIGPEGSASDYLTQIEGVSVLMSPTRLPRGMLYHLMYTMSAVDIYAILSNAETGKVEMRQHKLKPHVNLSQIASAWGGGGHIGAAGCYTQHDWDTFSKKFRLLISAQMAEVEF